LALAMAAGALQWAACTPRSRQPEQDLTPYRKLVNQWTASYGFRRTFGGDDLVSSQSAIVERPTHEEKLAIEATLFADTLVAAEVMRLCADDTSGASCDTIAAAYQSVHAWPDRFRVELRASANLSNPFSLEKLTIYLTDQNDIDYEPSRKVFSGPRTAERRYVDREVTRYNPHSASETRGYTYRHGYEYESTGAAILYFDRINAVGEDILWAPEAQLALVIRLDRRDVARLEWNVAEIRDRLRPPRGSAIETP